jgi:hypothetical protein
MGNRITDPHWKKMLTAKFLFLGQNSHPDEFREGEEILLLSSLILTKRDVSVGTGR